MITQNNISYVGTCFSAKVYALDYTDMIYPARDILSGDHSPWLILFWCCLKMYIVGQETGKTFTALRYFFNYVWQSTKKYIKPQLNQREWALFYPLQVSFAGSFSLSFHLNKISSMHSSEWLRLHLWSQREFFSFGDHESDTIHCKLPAQHIDGFVDNKPSQHPWDKSYLITVYEAFNVFLNLVC